MSAKPYDGLWDVVNAQGVSTGSHCPYQTEAEARAAADGYTKEPMNARRSKPFRAVRWFPLPITTDEVVESARRRCEKLSKIELRLLAMIDVERECAQLKPAPPTPTVLTVYGIGCGSKP